MRHGQHGFTLVEAAVSLGILAIVTLVMASTFLVGYTTISKEARTIAADTAVSDASLYLLRDLSSASAPVSGNIAGASTVSFAYGSPALTVSYSIAQGNLLRSLNGGTQIVVARGVTSVSITSSGCYQTVSIQPSATGAAAATLNVSSRPGGCF